MTDHHKDIDRRTFVHRTAAMLAAGAVALPALRATADDEFTMDSTTSEKCATCTFWGGVRKISRDGKTLSFESRTAKGWCNNPQSANYHQQTIPEAGPMKAWQKWEALG